MLLMAVAPLALGQPPVDPPLPEDNPVPITGLEYLLLSGGILGGYKLFRNKGKKTD